MDKKNLQILIMVITVLLTVAALIYKPDRAHDFGHHDDDPSIPKLKLIELGSTSCIPCQMMVPVLNDLRQEYPDTLRIEFVDVVENAELGRQHGIRMIPTQILFDLEGNEVFRHEGFFPKEEIVAKWDELGFDLGPPQDSASASDQTMLAGLFTILTTNLQRSLWIALLTAFIWGILSILLSPCHLASIPLIIGFIDEQGEMSNWRAFMLALSFSLGILATIAALGVATAGLGRMMGEVGPWGNYLVALVFLVVGFHLLEIIPAPWQGPGQVNKKGQGIWAAFMLGLIFGIALGPCTFAYMAPMLAITFQVGTTAFLFGSLLLIVYGIGHCGIIVLAGTCTSLVQHYLHWTEKSQGAIILKYVCGVLVLICGVYMVYIS